MQEKIARPKLPIKRHEKMRIAGKLVDADEHVEVRNPVHQRGGGDGAAGRPRPGGGGVQDRQRLQVEADQATTARRS